MDRLDRAARSALMAKVKGKDTGPELKVRRIAHALGYRFRLHRRDLPGSPDLVFPSRRAVVFVHGCFWHRHAGCAKASSPKTRKAFWNAKFETNVARDARVKRKLRRLGWRVLVVWECQARDAGRLAPRLARFLGPSSAYLWTKRTATAGRASRGRAASS